MAKMLVYRSPNNPVKARMPLVNRTTAVKITGSVWDGTEEAVVESSLTVLEKILPRGESMWLLMNSAPTLANATVSNLTSYSVSLMNAFKKKVAVSVEFGSGRVFTKMQMCKQTCFHGKCL